MVFLALQNNICESSSGQYKLVFEDNFEFFDKSKWTTEIGFRVGAFNTPNAIKIKDGKLIIQPYTKNNRHFSSIVTTENKFEVGVNSYIEFRAKLKPVEGVWLNLWLWNKSAGLNEEFNGSQAMEIDLIESRKFDYNNKYIGDIVNSTIHYGGYNNYHKCLAIDTTNLGIKLDDEQFHTFSLFWDQNGFQFMVDGKKTWKVNNLNTKAKMFLIISVEVGPTEDWVRNPADVLTEECLIVDFVKVYKKK